MVLFLLMYVSLAAAQTVQLENSTQKNWSGGVAGRAGTNYSFEIGFNNFDSSLQLDTLWVTGSFFPVIYKSTNGQTNTVKKRLKNKFVYIINVGISRDDYLTPSLLGGSEREMLPKPPTKIKGVALLTYRYHGKKFIFYIDRIRKTLPPANYP